MEGTDARPQGRSLLGRSVRLSNKGQKETNKQENTTIIARQANDRCFSTTPGWGEEKGGVGNPFNFDGVERDEIDADLARSAFDFEILKKPSYDAEGRRIPKQYHQIGRAHV